MDAASILISPSCELQSKVLQDHNFPSGKPGREGAFSGNRLSSFLLCCQELLFLRIEASPHLVDLNKESLM